MTEYQALRQIGFFSPLDFIMIGLLSACWVTLLFWRIFAEPTRMDVVIFALVTVALLQLWLVSLIYRCMHFVVTTRARIETMPDDAARIVIAAYSGGQNQRAQ